MQEELNQTPFTANLPQPVAVEGFQKELTRIFGVEPTTKRPWVRIVWPATDARDEFGEPLAFDWDEYGDGGRGLWRRRYLYSADVSYVDCYDPESGLWYAKECWEDVAPPRFMLERLIPPHLALMGWKHQGVDKDGMKWTSRCPLYGRYEALLILPQVSELLKGGMFARHDGTCCRAAKEEGVDCYGYYVEPGAEHVQELERLAYLQRKAKERRPGVQTAEEHEAAMKRSRERNERYWQKLGDKIQQIYVEGFKTHKARLSLDPSVNANGIYHWMSGTSKSGLTEEKRKELLSRKKAKA